MSAGHARSRPPGVGPSLVLDVEALRERAGHDEPVVVELLEDFLCRGVSMEELRAAAESRDLETLRQLAHRLRKALLFLGAAAAASAAAEVEMRAATLAISEAPDARARAGLSVALDALGERFDAARDAMRCVMDEATSSR